MRLNQHRRGFTLIELMIVVAIVAILATIAVPVYNDAVRKGRRGQAKADIAALAQQLERWHTVQNTYATLPGAAGAFPSPETGTAHYLITTVLTANTFTLTATPQGDQANDPCRNLTLTHTGAKGTSSGLEIERCW